MNIAEFPIALLTDRVPGGQSKLEFQDSIQDPGTGELVRRKLTISAPEQYGLPTAADDEVILGLIQLTKLENGFTERTVPFSRYELIRLLGWPVKGASYRRLEESLDRWVFVGLSYKKAWWDNRRKGWVDEKFHILERVSLFERGRGGPKAGEQDALPFSSFTWNEVIFHSFQSGYVKRLDLDFFLGLQSATAKRIYRFLDKHFYHRGRLEYDLRDFAFEHIGLSRVYRTGVLKQKLAPAVEELEAKGFLEPLPAHERYRQIRRGEWKVTFVKKGPPAEAKGPPAEAGPVEQDLALRGVTPAVAAQLAAAHPAAHVAAKVEVFDWLRENNDPRLAKNAAGYLVESIRKDYQPPGGFETRAGRERRQEAAAARQRAQEESRHQQEEATRLQQAREDAAREARRAHVDGYLAGLSAPERHALRQRAFDAAGAHLRPYRDKGGKVAGVVRQRAIDEEVLRVHPWPPPALGGAVAPPNPR